MNKPLKPRPTSNVFSTQEQLDNYSAWRKYDNWMAAKVALLPRVKYTEDAETWAADNGIGEKCLTDNWSEAHGYWHANV